MRPFQIILFAAFGALALGGLFMFATFRGFDREVDPLRGGVVIWGTLERNAFQDVLGDLTSNDDRWSNVQYVVQDERTFPEVLVNAIAEGTGPDMIVLPNDLLISQASKLQPITYEAYPLRDFRDTFVDGAEIFAFPAGIYGIPFAVDPLVMYWNQTMHSSAGLAYPPRTWEELVGVTVPSLTYRTDDNDIEKSALAFGEYSNVANGKETLIMLLLQAGSRLVDIGGSSFVVDLNASVGTTNIPPADYALRFYTEFSNPAKTTYTWNRALPRDNESFLAENLGLYFGFGSEYGQLRDGNSNLSFDVTEVPQSGNTAARKTYGTFYAFAIPKSSKNPAGAYEAARTLALGPSADALVRSLDFAPVRRDLIAAGSGSAIGDVVYRSALIAQAWLDPNPVVTDDIFKEMVEGVTSGRQKVSEAIENASYKIQRAF